MGIVRTQRKAVVCKGQVPLDSFQTMSCVHAGISHGHARFASKRLGTGRIRTRLRKTFVFGFWKRTLCHTGPLNDNKTYSKYDSIKNYDGIRAIRNAEMVTDSYSAAHVVDVLRRHGHNYWSNSQHHHWEDGAGLSACSTIHVGGQQTYLNIEAKRPRR